MKKIIFLVVILAVFCSGMSLFAQEQNQEKKKPESEYYYYNFPIEKIYSHRAGYVVIYRKSENRMARSFIPVEWFTDAKGKGELVGLRSGKDWPSMTVYYRSGEFSHVKLRVRADRTHSTWGFIPLNVNMDEYFDGVEEIELEF